MRLARHLTTILLVALVASALALGCSSSSVQTPAPAATGTAAAVPAAQAKWNGIVAAAKQEGKLNLYTNMAPETRDAMIKAFRQRYGIDIQATMGSSPELLQKILTERRANLNLFDVLMSGPTIISLKAEGVLAPVDKVLVLPEVLDMSAWPNNRLPFLDKDNNLIMLTGGFLSYLVAQNSVIENKEIVSIQDILKPQYKGKIVMDDPTMSRSANNWLVFLMKYALGPEKGKTYLRQLAAQEPVLTRDYRQIAEWVARGKSTIGIGPSQEMITEFQRMGAAIGYIRVAEGGVVHPGGSCLVISNKPENPNATALLVNWLLSADGQATYSNAFGKPGLRRGTPTEGLDPFSIAQPGDKAYYIDEEFVSYSLNEGIAVAKEIFGPLLR